MITKNIVLSFLREYKKLHSYDFNLTKLGLFGSVAREENNQYSDLDIVVEFSKPNLFVLSTIREDIKEKFHVDVDVVALSKGTNPRLLKRINKDVLYV